MRFIHLSDLHLGKRVNEFSMLEDQKYILAEIVNIIEKEKPEGVLIAGDVYDKSVPTEEAMKLWDDFLQAISMRHIPVYAISGNHDSAVRFSVHNKLMEGTGIHLAPAYDGKTVSYTLQDQYGEVNIYLLPFIKPALVRSVFPKQDIPDYTACCRAAISQMEVNPRNRNILVAHQFVTGAIRCESEEITVGGLDNVDASVFQDFDYVALGHIHGPQSVTGDTIRYCGTPLKYSFSEADHHKSVTIVELMEKGRVIIRTVPLTPLRDMRRIKGTYQELTSRKNYEGTNTEDYVHAILTDEEDIYDAMAKLRIIYPNLMKLTYDNKRTRENRKISDVMDVAHKSPIELFGEFYEMQNNQPMSEEQRTFTEELIRSVWKV